MSKTNISTVSPPVRLSDNKNYAFTDKEKAECLNDFFCSISIIDDSDNDLPNFENKTDSVLSNINITLTDVENKTDSVLSNINITLTDVEDILKLLRVNKTSGPDGRSHRRLINTCHTITKPLSMLFNISIQQKYTLISGSQQLLYRCFFFFFFLFCFVLL